ncbi:bstEII [Crocosphaera sp. UHCC 0190]|uniref:bstEII n=1 Tax=Crocosphaera sp. UHCC 0190 TaxID=3110246 RepID=UPI002B215C53|nr:bstEII [Crocosphaera sp. UHCC 0190]MEA5510445.1 bstEII [Crocosphaera sp. UHCC 0190]
MSNFDKYFADYKSEGHNWITLASGEYYPDILKDACELYKPVLILFHQLLTTSESSERLLIQISGIPSQWMRIQLARVFRKYVSPSTPVEMLKRKTKVKEICEQFGKEFRNIQEVQAAFSTRPIPDEALCALLWEYKDRGKKGYDLTERLFDLFRSNFPDLVIKGPERAGKDIFLGTVFKNYPNPKRPVDFVVYDQNKKDVLAIGLARYDSDRGGAQEDDRIGGYRNCADEILQYAKNHNLNTKVIFINDGPGLLLGSMWNDYATIERSWEHKIMVLTLRMIPYRLTIDWLKST